MMRLIFWKRDGNSTKKQLDAVEKAAATTHRKNIEKIVNSRKDAGKVIKELKRNNITLELAKAIGH
jgi:hypothetical protein